MCSGDRPRRDDRKNGVSTLAFYFLCLTREETIDAADRDLCPKTPEGKPDESSVCSGCCDAGLASELMSKNDIASKRLGNMESPSMRAP